MQINNEGKEIQRIKSSLYDFESDILEIIKGSCKKEKLDRIYDSSVDKLDSIECCKTGSYIYFLYDSSNNIIYIGETEKNIRDRLFGNGSGAHKQKKWFGEVNYVKYYKNDCMDYNTRKILERLLIKKYNPRYNDSNYKKNNSNSGEKELA